MRRRGTRGLDDRIGGDLRHAAIDHDALRGARELEGQAAGRRLLGQGPGRRGAHIGHQQSAPGLQALVAGMGRVVDRLAAHVVIGEQRRQVVGGRHPHAVEMREGAVPMPEQAHHGQHPVDGAQERLGRIDLAAGEHLAQGQQIEQQLDDDARIAAHMPAIGQDLALELAGEQATGPAQIAVEPLAAQARIAERNRCHELLIGQGAGAHLALEGSHMLPDDSQETLVEGVIRPFQDQRRLADEGHEPARRDLGVAGDPLVAELRGDELVHQGAGIGLGQRRAGGAQVAQPAEAVERLAPGAARGQEREGRAPACGDGAARESEEAGIDVGRDGGIGRAQVLRREKEPRGHGRAGEPRQAPDHAFAHGAAGLAKAKPVQTPAIRPEIHPWRSSIWLESLPT